MLGGRLHERDSALAAVGKVMDSARGGAGGGVAVVGAAGIGKTSVLTAVVAGARANGWLVLTARGAELERENGFGVVRQLFERHLAERPESERHDLLSGAAGFATTVLDASASEHGSPGASFTTLHGLYWLVSNLCAGSPVLLVVDDSHWADRATVGWLEFLALRAHELPLAVLLGYRPAANREVETLVAAARWPALDLVPLSPEAVAKAVAAERGRLAAERIAGVCHEVTGGNPFLLDELLRALADAPDSPEAVRDAAPSGLTATLRARLRGLPEVAWSVVEAVAILGDGVSPQLVAEFVGLPKGDVAALAGSLGDVGVLAPSSRLEFQHPLLRSAVYEEIPPARRAADHARAARLTEPAGAALHLLRSVPAGDPAVVAALCSAADAALGQGAPEEASRYVWRALEEPPGPDQHPEVLRLLGVAQLTLSDPSAAEHLGAALAAEADPGRRVEIAHLLAAVLLAAGRHADGARALESVLESLPPEARELRLVVQVSLVLCAILVPDLDGTALEAGIADELGAAGADPRTPPERLALTALGFWAMCQGRDVNEPLAQVRRALSAGSVFLEHPSESPVAVMAVNALMMAGRYAEAIEQLGVGLDQARRTGSAYGFAHLSAWRAECLWRAGELRLAEADARAVLALPFVEVEWRTMAAAVLISVLTESGEREEAEALLRESEPDAGGAHLTLLLRSKGRLALMQRRPEHALTAFEAATQHQAGLGMIGPGYTSFLALRSFATFATGEAQDAQALAASALAEAEAYGAPEPLGIALRAVAQSGGGDAIALLERSVQALADSEARLEHARSLIALGAALRRANRRAAARAPLAEGRDLALAAGASLLANEAEDELRAAGASPRGRHLTGGDSLTPSEHRIAALAAGGMSNREIAQALFLTLKTVEMHLTSAYRKLGISGRQGLDVRLLTDAA